MQKIGIYNRAISNVYWAVISGWYLVELWAKILSKYRPQICIVFRYLYQSGAFNRISKQNHTLLFYMLMENPVEISAYFSLRRCSAQEEVKMTFLHILHFENIFPRYVLNVLSCPFLSPLFLFKGDKSSRTTRRGTYLLVVVASGLCYISLKVALLWEKAPSLIYRTS